MFNADSIHFTDSVLYYTKSANRVVHGGGGIMPDVFVPLDTTFSSKFYGELLRKNVLGDFTLTYADNNRNQLKKDYPDITSFQKSFKVSEKMWNDFMSQAEKEGVKRDTAGIATSGNFIRLQIKALIARDLWNSDSYFEIINDVNSALHKAMDAIQDNTFEKMKIAER